MHGKGPSNQSPPNPPSILKNALEDLPTMELRLQGHDTKGDDIIRPTELGIITDQLTPLVCEGRGLRTWEAT